MWKPWILVAAGCVIMSALTTGTAAKNTQSPLDLAPHEHSHHASNLMQNSFIASTHEDNFLTMESQNLSNKK